MYQLSFLLAGRPRVWVAIAARHGPLLEHSLLRYQALLLGARNAQPWCSQLLQHLSMWVRTAALAKWKVPFKMVVQRPGELVVIPPGARYQVFDMGA